MKKIVYFIESFPKKLSNGYRFLVIKNMLVAYVDEKGNTGYVLANGEMSDKSITNLIDFYCIEAPYDLLWKNQ